MMPSWLERHEQVLVEELNPSFIKIDDQEIELNLVGFGKKNGKEVLIIGECKSRIYSGDVKKFYKKIEKTRRKFPKKEMIPFMFGFLIHPQAELDAKMNAIRLIATYMK